MLGAVKTQVKKESVCPKELMMHMYEADKDQEKGSGIICFCRWGAEGERVDDLSKATTKSQE